MMEVKCNVERCNVCETDNVVSFPPKPPDPLGFSACLNCGSTFGFPAWVARSAAADSA